MPHRRRQQSSDPLAPPTISGLAGEVTQSTSATISTFVFDSTFTGQTAEPTAPSLAPFSTVVITESPTPSVVLPSSSSLGHSIPLSTVLGACLGTFFAVTTLVLLGLWIYKRNNRQSRNTPRKPLRNNNNNNNARRENERSRAKSESWTKLEDADLKLKGTPQTKQIDYLGPMEKLTMFKHSSPDDKSPEKVLDPFAAHHPNSSPVHHHTPSPVNHSPSPVHPPKRPFLARSQPRSWADDEATVKSDSLLGVSPPISRALPTPQVTPHQPHQWESAQVMHFDDLLPKKVNKGKGKARSVLDEQAPAIPARIAHHVANASASSTASNERAIQSLIAALDVTAEEVEERLRVASMMSRS